MNPGIEVIPKYPFDEMKTEMSKYGVEITHSILKNPTTEDIQGIYSICIKHILNKDISSVRIEEFAGDLKSAMPSIDGIQILPNEGKNHLQAIGNLRFLRYCERINKILSLDNILSYIFKPVSSHMSKLISGFIHFMKYKEEIYNENEIKIKKINDKKSEDNILESELASVDRELQSLLLKHDEIKLSIVNEKNNKKNYEEEIIENQNKLNAHQSKILNLKSTKDKITNETNELVFKFSRLRQKKEDLEDQIVPSPEKLQQYNEELKDILQERLARYENYKKTNEEIKNKITVADICIKKLLDLFTVLTNHLDEIIKIHIDKKKQIKQLETNIKELILEKEKWEKKREEHFNILDNSHKNYEDEQIKWNEKIEKEKENKIKVEKEVQTIYENVENINNKMNRTINEIKNLIKFTDDTINTYHKNHEILNNLIENTKNSNKILANKLQMNIENIIQTNV